MTGHRPGLVLGFCIPNFVITCDRIYLAGHSFFVLHNEQPSLAPVPATTEEQHELPVLRTLISSANHFRLATMLNMRPTLPRLLCTSRGKCDQDAHEALLGLLLFNNRLRDLERLYGIVIADCQLPCQMIESDEQPQYQVISQKELFGGKLTVVHDNVVVRRSLNTALDPSWPSDLIAYPPVPPSRTPARFSSPQICALQVERQIGHGSYGYVFVSNGSLLKFSTATSEYVRELLSQFVLEITSFSDSTSHPAHDLPQEVATPTSARDAQINHHLLTLTPLHCIKPHNISEYAMTATQEAILESGKVLRGLSMAPTDQLAIMVRNLLNGIRALRDRFIMHLDISTANVMWEKPAGGLRVIDYGGTIGDDSFLDLGPILPRLCTRTTRAPEYAASDNLWQRNESSETLSAYYAIMSHTFHTDLLKEQPQAKEAACANQVAAEIEVWNSAWRERAVIVGRDPAEELPVAINCIRRVHQAARGLPRDRPPLDWIISDGSDESDRRALEMGCIGSMTRYAHMRLCLSRFIKQWPLGTPLRSAEDVAFWMPRRSEFITLLVSRISCGIDGSTCGGLVERMVPPPYTAARCILLYDALRDIVRNSSTTASLEPDLVRLVTDQASYPLLLHAILYVALSASKAVLIEVSHHAQHPLHILLRTINNHKYLVSLFLSPITAYALLVLETPRAHVNDEAAGELRKTTVPQPRPETSHRILRCLYNLRAYRRCRPMISPNVAHIAKFVKKYMGDLFREPMVMAGESDWWKLLRISSEPLPENSVGLPPHSDFIDGVISLWFT